MIKAVIFDMDGLLINSEPFWRKSQKQLFSSIGIDLKDDIFEQFMGKRIDEVIAQIYRQHPWEAISKEEVERQLINRVIEMINLEGEAMEGVIQILDLFRDQGMLIALASSSCIKIIDTVLKKLMIEEYFEVIHSAEYEKHGKPHPHIFINAAKRLGVASEECLVFEDSYNGVLAASAAKMKCIAVPEPRFGDMEKFKIAQLTLKSLTEFSLSHLHMLCREDLDTDKSTKHIN